MTLARLVAALMAAVLIGHSHAAETLQPPGGAVSGAATTASAPAASGFRVRPVDDAWRASLPRNAEAATQAYLDRLPADVVARSAAYFEGGYWLQGIDFLVGLLIAALLLSRRRSARVRDWAERVGRKAVVRDAIYGALPWPAGPCRCHSPSTRASCANTPTAWRHRPSAPGSANNSLHWR
jgi:STE24 endopeptidase